MILLVAALFAAVFWLPSPLGWILFAVAVAFEGAQTVFTVRWSRKGHERVGPQTLIGRTAVVVLACRPYGQVRLEGELWQARCPHGADAGAVVEVTGRDGLMLAVRPREVGPSRAG